MVYRLAEIHHYGNFMTKRTTFQGKRRQVRRALNTVGEDGPTKLGLSRARNHGYGTGITARELKPRPFGQKEEVDETNS